MVTRTYMTVVSKFEDDGEWDNDGNLLVPGGLALGTTIVDLLSKHGFTSSKPVQHSFYGWEFTILSSGLSIWCIIQAGHLGTNSWLLIFNQRVGLVQQLFRLGDARFQSFLIKFNELMRHEESTLQMGWYTRAEYESGKRKNGFPTPVA